MAHPDHVAKLLAGIPAWNTWRAENPDVLPDLSGIDLSNATEFGRLFGKHQLFTEARRFETVDGADLSGGNFSFVDFAEARLRNVFAMNASFQSADFTRSDFTDALLFSSDFRHSKFIFAVARHADFGKADLTSAIMRGTDLRYADFHGSNLTGIDARFAIFGMTHVLQVTYSRRLMSGRWLGAANIDACYGEARFISDAKLQTSIDSKWFELKCRYFQRRAEVFTFDDPMLDDLRLSEHILAPPWLPSSVRWLRWLVLAWAPVRFQVGVTLFAIWGLTTDYGRSLGRLLLTIAILIVIFGLLTRAMEATGHIQYLWPATSQLVEAPVLSLRGFYVAAVCFAGLGYTALASPISALGEAFLLLNALTGYVMLGLLLAVFLRKTIQP